MLSILLGLGSLGFSVYAVKKALSAEIAAKSALEHRDHQDDLQSLRDLMVVLEAAKEGARNWLPGVDVSRQIGQSEGDDIEKLRKAIDAIRTSAPMNLPAKSDKRVQKGGDALERYCNDIASSNVNENMWPGVVSEIQSMVRSLRALEREFANKLALPK